MSDPKKSPDASLDEKKSEAFAESILGILNNGALALMISIGHRTGLFDAMGDGRPRTSAEIAGQAGLQERYVREWLGAMVTGRIVTYEPSTKRYTLPAEHAAWMARAASPNCLAVYAQYVAILGEVESEIVRCFREGGGVPYSRYPRFHEVMAEDSGQSIVAALEEHVLPLIPETRERLRTGIDVLDVGCGSGRALLKMAALFPASRFRGYDFSEEAVAAAASEAKARGLDNVSFHVRDCAALDETDTYDFIVTFDSIHDQADPDAVLRAIARALRPDGLYLMQDIKGSSELHENIDHPLGPFLYTVSTMHCMTVSLAQGGRGLGTMWGRGLAREMLAKAGFKTVEIRELDHDPQNDYYLVGF